METIKMPVNYLKNFAEYDRETEKRPDFGFVKGTDLDKLTEDIRENGLKSPIQLCVYEDKALIVEGNHRLAACLRLGYTSVIVEIVENDDYYLARKDRFVKI